MNVVPIVGNKTTQPESTQGSKGLSDSSKLKLQKAVKDFEAIFVNYMLENMRKTVPTSEKDQGFGNDVMQGMFDLEMSKHMSETGSFGIGAMMYKQLTGESMPTSGQQMTDLLRTVGSHMTDRVHGLAPSANHISQNVAQYDDSIQEASSAYGLDPNLIKAVIAAESGGNARAVSSKNAKGLMQLIDTTAEQMGVADVWNPQDNILGGSKYLKSLMDKFGGDLKLAVASYNAGPDTVEQHGGVPPIQETQQYVERVMKYLQIFQEQGVMGNDNP